MIKELGPICPYDELIGSPNKDESVGEGVNDVGSTGASFVDMIVTVCKSEVDSVANGQEEHSSYDVVLAVLLLFECENHPWVAP